LLILLFSVLLKKQGKARLGRERSSQALVEGSPHQKRGLIIARSVEVDVESAEVTAVVDSDLSETAAEVNDCNPAERCMRLRPVVVWCAFVSLDE